ncbi:MAG: DmsC/YnfH family molybdoenzyme membrane anchor subunit [Bacteroidales bacterium]|nr:DmsC/YnfH family molybdoenzyme membrane anchor subunit [Bacteroidales bacterium]
MHEWSLIVFTILTQIAVGAFVVATIVKLAKGIFHGEKVLHTLYPVFLLVAVAALTTSFLHPRQSIKCMVCAE